MVDRGRITQQQSDKLFEIFERGYNNNEQKRINRLEKGLNDKDNIDRIVASSNLKLKQSFKRQGSEYEKNLINIVREEAKQKEGKILIQDPDNPNRKIVNPNIDIIDNDGDPEIENEVLNNLNKDGYNRNRFTTIQQINDFIQNNNNNNIINKEDKYILNNINYNIFYTNEEYRIRIVFDIIDQESDPFSISVQQIYSLFLKYFKNDDVGFNKKVADNISSILLKDLLTNYYTINEKSNIIKYSNYIIDFVDNCFNYFFFEDFISGSEREKKSEKFRGFKEDVSEIPKITKLKNIFDKLDTKHITINDQLEVANAWNNIFSKNLGFIKIWTYLGLDTRHFTGRFRGTNIYEKIFKNNPYYSKEHKLFAIEGLEALKDKANIIKNYDKLQTTFTKKNQELFSDKGETLSSAEAKKIFDKIIAALNKEDIDKLREQQSNVSKEKYKTGSGRKKKKHNTLKTTILNILNS